MDPNKIVDFKAEYIKMKKNNSRLAKALAVQHQISKKYLDENVILRKKLYEASSLITKFETKIDEISNSLRLGCENGIALSQNLSEAVIICQQTRKIKTSFEYNNKNSAHKETLRSSSPGGPQKTHAVKPMVSGHVIHNPIINLSRLTETRVSVLDSSDTLDDTDESLTENDDSSPDVENDRVSNFYSLHTINEEESTNNSINNSCVTKEVRVMIDPLHLENINFYARKKCVKFVQPEKIKAKRANEDPLEGTSSMLDDSGNLKSCKPRQASKRMCTHYESDSEESTAAIENEGKRSVTKRKSPTKKKDITGQKYKVKRNKMMLESNNSINSSLERSHIENNEEGDTFINERRSRRSARKSMAEPSLKCKLRR